MILIAIIIFWIIQRQSLIMNVWFHFIIIIAEQIWFKILILLHLQVFCLRYWFCVITIFIIWILLRNIFIASMMFVILAIAYDFLVQSLLSAHHIDNIALLLPVHVHSYDAGGARILQEDSLDFLVRQILLTLPHDFSALFLRSTWRVIA